MIEALHAPIHSRKIIHVDMDAFFASVEQRDNPQLQGVPVVVGGHPNSRGVVCAASYEARKFGIRSAMPCGEAFERCRHAVFVPPRFEVYKSVSNQIMQIFRQHTDLVEALSLDEAYLDVTENKNQLPYATAIAKLIRHDIFKETGLTASAGVAPNKFLAKVASDLNKPNGLVVIPPEKIMTILKALPVRALPGVGKVTENKMHTAGIFTTEDIRNTSLIRLNQLFGKTSAWYFDIAHGRDDRAVIPYRERKSVGAEDTFSQDVTDRATMLDKLAELSERVTHRMKGVAGLTLTLKVTYAGFVKISRRKTEPKPLVSSDIYSLSERLLAQTEAGHRAVRLLGLSISNFLRDEVKTIARENRQLRLGF